MTFSFDRTHPDVALMCIRDTDLAVFRAASPRHRARRPMGYGGGKHAARTAVEE